MNNNYNQNNIFAKILKSEIDCKKINENDYALAFLDVNPLAPIHILIIPKNPYVNMYDFNKNASSDEILGFWKLVNSIIEQEGMENNGFRAVSNCGKDGNQDVPHFHVHILGGKNLGKMIKLDS